jgi:hypothetical protein
VLRGTAISSLPAAIGRLNLLEDLNLGFCTKLDSLPAELPAGLLDFKLFGCRQLKSVPDSLFNLRKLQRLHLQDCKAMSVLPTHLGQSWPDLDFLDLRGCGITFQQNSRQKMHDQIPNCTIKWPMNIEQKQFQDSGCCVC